MSASYLATKRSVCENPSFVAFGQEHRVVYHEQR
jgi:hypothetical protein